MVILDEVKAALARRRHSTLAGRCAWPVGEWFCETMPADGEWCAEHTGGDA